MTQAAASRLVVTEWTKFLFFAQSLAGFGFILGLVFGYSKLKGKTIAILAIGYSLVFIPLQLAFAISGGIQFTEKLVSIGGRLSYSLSQFLNQDIVDDGLLFVAFISTITWIIGLSAGFWWMRYQNYLATTLPGAIFALTIHFYDPGSPRRSWLIATYIMLALILLGHTYYTRKREEWQEKRVFQMQGGLLDINRGIAITAFVFILTAWSIPASQTSLDSAIRTWRRLTGPWRDVQEWFSNAVEVLDANPLDDAGDVYGNKLNLGSGNPLSTAVVFKVDAPNPSQKPPRYYWRGFVYDTYQNDRWYATSIIREGFIPADTELFLPDMEQRTDAIFVIETRISQSLLYTASQPLWVSRPGEIQFALMDDGKQDILAWKAEPEMFTGEQYHVASALANPSIQQLRQAGTEYPEWITERYLQLPDDFSPRIQELAAELTWSSVTPYDKANAITYYLRNEIQYTNPLTETPTSNEDPLEWFLFDSKKGFCTYYATAEILMLRSVGVPARMAAGFSQGEYDNATNTYTVRNLNAHAWPEVYFPGFGWVEFEPTGNQSPLVRPDRPVERSDGSPFNGFDPLDRERGEEGLEENLDEEGGLLGPDDNIEVNARPFDPILYYYLGAGFLLAITLWLINLRYAFIDKIPGRIQTAYERNGAQAPAWLQNWTRWAELSPIERSFETINRSLRLLGGSPAFTLTPQERADLLTEKLPAATEAIQILAEEHETFLFRPGSGQVKRARHASLSIWLYTMQNRTQRFFQRVQKNKPTSGHSDD